MGWKTAWVRGSVLAALGLLGACGGDAEPTKASKPAVAGSALGRASREFMPPELAGAELDMSLSDLQKLRPGLRRNVAADDEALIVYEEGLPGNARAIYLLGKGDGKLRRVQLARSLEAVTQIEPRVRGAQEKHGAASGVWDCTEAAGQLPTRRFAWFRQPVAAMDSYLLVGERVAVTWFVAPIEDIYASLGKARCAPTAPDRFTHFPAVPPTNLPTPAPTAPAAKSP